MNLTNFQKQMLEAAGWTFLETFLVTIGPSVAVLHVGDWGALAGIATSAAISAAAAAVSLIKSKIVKNVGGADSPLITAPTCEVTEDGAVG